MTGRRACVETRGEEAGVVEWTIVSTTSSMQNDVLFGSKRRGYSKTREHSVGTSTGRGIRGSSKTCGSDEGNLSKMPSGKLECAGPKRTMQKGKKLEEM